MTLPPELRQVIESWTSLSRDVISAVMALVGSQ
jgi:hypothetical protein